MTALPALMTQVYQQALAARQVTQTPTAIAPPSINVSSVTPTGTPPPPLPGVAPQPSTAMYYPSVASPSFTDYSAAPSVSAAAISPEPTALTGDNMTPEAQANNRANLIKVVAVVGLIWLILSQTGR